MGDGVVMREGKKVPPPPPVRRTSTLSTAPAGQQAAFSPSPAQGGEEGTVAPPTAAEVNKGEIITHTDSVQDIVTRFNTAGTNQSKVNGRVVNKKYEETEIYKNLSENKSNSPVVFQPLLLL